MAMFHHVSSIDTDENDEQASPLVSTNPRVTANMRRTFALAGGFLLLVAPLVFVAAHRPVAATFLGADTGAVTGLSAVDPCSEFPFLRFDSVINNNLGELGPERGAPEGLHLRAFSKDTGTLELHINVKPGTNFPGSHFGAGNGLKGKFAQFTIQGGQSTTLVFRTYPSGTSAHMKADPTFNPSGLELPKLDLTVFDIDQHNEKHSVEFVKVSGFSKAFRSKNSELAMTKEADRLVFKATSYGDGKDNPSNPLQLNDKQMNRAVSVEYEKFTETQIVFGSEHGHLPRAYLFIGRPAILCAEGASDDNGAVTISEDGKVIEDTCCLLKVGPVQIMCAASVEAQWYHFMC